MTGNNREVTQRRQRRHRRTSDDLNLHVHDTSLPSPRDYWTCPEATFKGGRDEDQFKLGFSSENIRTFDKFGKAKKPR